MEGEFRPKISSLAPINTQGSQREREKSTKNKGEVRDLFQSRRPMLQSASHLARLPTKLVAQRLRRAISAAFFLCGDLVRKKKSFAKSVSQGRLFIMRLFLIEQQP